MKKLLSLVGSALLVCAVSASAADKNITPTDDIKAIVETELAEGDVLILGDGEYNVESTVEISKSITIKAANAGKAILDKYQFVVPAGSTIENLAFENLVSKHVEDQGKYFLQVNTATSYVKNLSIKGCYIQGYGRGAVRATESGSKIDNAVVEDCVFTNMGMNGAGYAVINPQKANVKSFKVSNCTFYNSKSAIFRYEGPETIDVLFEYCTVINCGSSEGRKMMEVGGSVTEASTFKVKNSIFTGSFDATTPAGKTIDFQNKGDVESSLLEGFSDPLLNRTTETSPVTGTVLTFDMTAYTMTTDPSTIAGIGDARWTLNGSQGGSNIETTGMESEIIATEYYNVAGVKVTELATGITIVKNVMKDGSVKVNKVFVK